MVIEDYASYTGLEALGVSGFFGVFDGHGGIDAAKFVETQLPTTVAARLGKGASVRH